METKPLKGFEAFYTIREDGLITSLSRVHETRGRFGMMTRKCGGKILKSHLEKGYEVVELNANRIIKKALVHRLVYSTFIGDLVEGMVIHHKDKNKTNNHVSNLEQCNYIEHNNIHAHPPWNKGIKNPQKMIENARKKRLEYYIPLFKKTHDLRKDGKSNKEISLILNISERTVTDRIKRYKELTSESNR
jgi:hypothetical protein